MCYSRTSGAGITECRVESIECRCCPRICAEFYYRRGIKFPSAEGWHEVPGWLLYPTPRRAKHDTPRPQMVRWAFEYVIARALSPPCHSRAGGNRAWVIISYLIGGNNSALCFYYYKICDMNLIDPIPALSTPQIHSYLRGPRARE